MEGRGWRRHFGRKSNPRFSIFDLRPEQVSPPIFMSVSSRNKQQTPLNTLRQFAGKEEPREAAEQEQKRCELCSEPIPPSRHRHLLDMSSRQVMCACNACGLLFEDNRASKFGKNEFKLIPRDARALPGFQMTELQWNRLSLPINMAFFFYRTPAEDASEESASTEDDTEIAALYPSPAGATESLLPLKAWEALAGENPALEEMKPDVEALLVNRVDEAEEYYIAPIDTCYELVGLIRLHWRGFSGGQEVWDQIEAFFDRLG